MPKGKENRPKKSPMEKYTLADFQKQFPDDDACLEWLKNYLYPDGIFCEKCDKITKHHKVASRRSYSCDYCGHHVHPTAGTIYHKSPTKLTLWFYAIYQMASTRCGISAKQLEREIGVTYKCAWRMFKQIRSMLEETHELSMGHFEIDETYVGGSRPGKRGRGAANKTILAGVLNRETSTIEATVVPNVKAKTLIPLVQERAAEGSTVYTDEMSSYNKLTNKGYVHQWVNHSAKIYAIDDAHTNGVEGFWALVKNAVRGVHHGVGPHYLQSYANEYSFRYNHRDNPIPMFYHFLGQVKKFDG